MIKFILPAILFFLIILFWDKINDFVYKKFNIKINLIISFTFILVLFGILTLLYF